MDVSSIILAVLTVLALVFFPLSALYWFWGSLTGFPRMGAKKWLGCKNQDKIEQG